MAAADKSALKSLAPKWADICHLEARIGPTATRLKPVGQTDLALTSEFDRGASLALVDNETVTMPPPGSVPTPQEADGLAQFTLAFISWIGASVRSVTCFQSTSSKLSRAP